MHTIVYGILPWGSHGLSIRGASTMYHVLPTENRVANTSTRATFYYAISF